MEMPSAATVAQMMIFIVSILFDHHAPASVPAQVPGMGGLLWRRILVLHRGCSREPARGKLYIVGDFKCREQARGYNQPTVSGRCRRQYPDASRIISPNFHLHLPL
jgi:hypothetical protein